LCVCVPAGRAYPDVSGFGTAYVTINAGLIVPAAGTSASVPLVATMIALCQDNNTQRTRTSTT
jgi:tripeptidyl-peptidase-1